MRRTGLDWVLREPGAVCAINICSTIPAWVADALGMTIGSRTATVIAIALSVALTVLNVSSAWSFEVRWSRGFWGLLGFYELLAVGAALCWWAQGR